jgi:hypothetical protein
MRRHYGTKYLSKKKKLAGREPFRTFSQSHSSFKAGDLAKPLVPLHAADSTLSQCVLVKKMILKKEI